MRRSQSMDRQTDRHVARAHLLELLPHFFCTARVPFSLFTSLSKRRRKDKTLFIDAIERTLTPAEPELRTTETKSTSHAVGTDGNSFSHTHTADLTQTHTHTLIHRIRIQIGSESEQTQKKHQQSNSWTNGRRRRTASDFCTFI